MSKIKVVEKVVNNTGGQQVPALDFVRQYTELAAVISKATPGTDRVTRDAVGNRKVGSPDYLSMLHVHRSISKRNKDAKLTLQMLPDLKLAIEMIVSLIMSPKDMFNDEVIILSDSSDLLPASIMQSLLQVTTEYYRKNHDLSNFVQHMLYEVLAHQGALPTAVIPENALDDLINNYNNNIGLEHFRSEFDIETKTPLPVGLLGVPDYLAGRQDAKSKHSTVSQFGKSVCFDLQSYSKMKGSSLHSSVANSTIGLSSLISKPSTKEIPWIFKAIDNSATPINANDMIIVTDNPTAIKMPSYTEASMGARVGAVLTNRGYNKLSASVEALGRTVKQKHALKMMAGKGHGDDQRRITDAEVESLIFKNRRFAHTPVATVRNNMMLKRNSIGEPLIKVFDTACYIPVSIEGDPTRKLGGYVMLDEDGYPLTNNAPSPDEIGSLSELAGSSGNFLSTMIDRSNQILNGKDCEGMNNYTLKRFFTRAFAETVEKDLIDRIKNGQYDNGASLANNEDFYWLLLTRCLKGQRTQLLWLPAEFVVYFAMDYDEMGFGKSLLDDIRNITSMRIMLMVSGMTASMRNSIGRTKVSIKLDEEDPDAEKSLEDLQDEILKSRMNPIPFGINNVADISMYLQRACYEFEISGSSAIPDMQVEFNQYNTDYPKPDEDLQEQLKDLSIQHMGLRRDMIEAADSAEFEIQAATSNLLTMKRVQRWQKTIGPLITEYIRKISLNSEYQIKSYREILTNNFEQMQIPKLKSYFGIEDDKLFQDEDFKKLCIEQCISAYINNLTAELPNPGASTLDSQKTAFSQAEEFYKDALEHVVNEAFFDTAVQGEGMSDHVDTIKSLLLSHFMRQWMADNGVMQELADLTLIGEDGKVAVNIMDSLETHIKALGMSTEGFFRRLKTFAEMQSALMEDVGESSTDYDSGDSSSSSDDEGGGGGDDDLEFGEDDEFNFDEGGDEEGGDEDEGGDDNPAEEGEDFGE